MKRYAPYFLIAVGLVVIVIGGIGAPAGPPGMSPMPRETGALVGGIVLILFGAGWFGYDWFHRRRRHTRRFP